MDLDIFKLFMVAAAMATIGFFLWILLQRRHLYLDEIFIKLGPLFLATIAVIFGVILILRGGSRVQSSPPEMGVQMVQGEPVKIEEEFRALREAQVRLEEAVRARSQAEESKALAAILVRLDAVEKVTGENAKAIETFEGLVMTRAEQLVTLPILRRDLEAGRSDVTSIKNEVSVLRGMVSELGTQGRWVIGTFALGLFGLILQAIRTTRPVASKKDESDEAA